MFGDRLARLILFSSYIWGFCLGTTNLAQIVPDSTLSNESSVVVEDGSVDPGQIVDLIKNGAIRGKTVFHSFEEFNVLSEQLVYFANPKGIEQVITRVTGNNPSDIFGRLGVNGNADLFLLNPNGILFGENASLDIGGSFIATTADSLIFDRDLVYSADNPELPPLLEVKIPKGIQFGSNAETITVRGEGHELGFDSSTLMPTGNAPSSGLKVPTGKTLALIASELELNGGNLNASEGKIELAAIAQSGRIELKQKNNLFTFDYDEINNFGNINLSQQSFLDVRGGKNLGSVSLLGKDITLQDGSTIIVNKLRSGKSKTKGRINFVADSLNIVNNAPDIPSGVFTQIEQSSNHSGADINIDANKLQLQNNALIVSTITNKGKGGNININARQIDLIDNYDLPYNAGIYSQALSEAKGDVGIVNVELDDLQLLKDQRVIFIDDEDDLEDLIGEDRAEDLEDFIEDNEDRNIVIGTSESDRRSLIFRGGGEITSIDRESQKAGVAIFAAETIDFFNTPKPEVPEPEILEPKPEPEPEPEPEVLEPEPEPEPEPELEPEVLEPEPEVLEPKPEPKVFEPEPEVPEPEVLEPEPKPEPEVPEPEPEVPEPEPEPEVPEPEVPEPEVLDINQNSVSDRVYTFELSSGQEIVVDAEDFRTAAQSESVDRQSNSSNSNRAIEIHASSLSTVKTSDLDFDIPSACSLGDDNFVLVGKGGMAENPFRSIIEKIIIPDIEPKLPSEKKNISFREIDNSPVRSDSIIEAQNWKINQSGKVELLAAPQKSINSLADTPNCLD